MANRFPLIFNSGAGQIQELAASDNLDLTSSNLVNAGILFTSSGSQTAPSISIGNGTTYPPGLYSPGTNQLAVATNGTGKLFVDTNGTILVNTTIQATSNGGLSIETTGAGTLTTPLALLNRGTTNNTGVTLSFRGLSAASAETDYAYLRMLATDTTSRHGRIEFWTANSGTVTEKLCITRDGLVGIGDSSPTARLVCNGSIQVTSTTNPSTGAGLELGYGAVNPSRTALQSYNRTGSAWLGADYNALDHRFYISGGGSPQMTLTSTGLGIGIAIPSATLHVNGTTFANSTADGIALLETGTSGSAVNQYMILSHSPGAGAYSYTSLKFGTTEFLGAGENLSSYAGAVKINAPNSSVGYVQFSIGTAEKARIRADGMFEVKGAGVSGSSPAFSVNGSAPANSFVIDSSGRLGIGTSGPSSKLDVTVPVNVPTTGNPSAGSFITARGNTTTAGYGPSFQLANISGAKETIWRISAVTASGNNGDLVFNGYNGGEDYPERMRITAGGLVGINTTSPSTALQVNGTVTATTFQSTSDINLKENIKTVNNSLNIVSQLRGVTFDWKNTHQASIGVIAQEVEQILPELVSGGENKTVNYNGIIGILVEAIKEQEVRIEKLENKLNAQ